MTSTPQQNFPLFLQQLVQKQPIAWNWLFQHFYSRVYPWLLNQAIPTSLLKGNKKAFLEDVFSNSLSHFYAKIHKIDHTQFTD